MNETVDEFLARGGKIKEVCTGGADRLINEVYKKPWKLNSKYHHNGNFVSSSTLVIGMEKVKSAKWASHSIKNKDGCKKT